MARWQHTIVLRHVQNRCQSTKAAHQTGGTPGLYKRVLSPLFFLSLHHLLCDLTSSELSTLPPSTVPLRTTMSMAFNTSSEDLILEEVDTVLGDLLTLARKLIDISASLPADMNVDKDAAEVDSAELPIGSTRAPTSSEARIPAPPQVNVCADAREALVSSSVHIVRSNIDSPQVSFTRIEQVCSKFRRGVVDRSVRVRIPQTQTQTPFPATRTSEYSSSTAATENFFSPAPPMYADATFPFAYAQSQTFPSNRSSSAYGPASTYNPASAFRSAPFGGYMLPVPNTFADVPFRGANPLNGPPPNFSIFERRGPPAQRPTQVYMLPKPGQISHSGFTRPSNDRRLWSMTNPQISSPGNRVYNSPRPPHFIAAPIPVLPIDFSATSFGVDTVEGTPAASSRFNPRTSAAPPVARMPQTETSHETNVNRGRPVFTNPFDNNRVIVEDMRSELGSTTVRQDVAPVESPKSKMASDSMRPEEAANQNGSFGFPASSCTKIEGLDYNIPFEEIYDLDPNDPRIPYWTGCFNHMRALGTI
ncbi:hypothetical protein IW261DRAFT_1511525 [Armillaria novae-zelandiae]|uniref:Uncharacterized protein n=1 Tax=Armillaria novae-zelandiae TaxID=153914 RepID=A0AA39U6B5_9AGAR|nr:hypothetical protein IW261DRAFT_1511525 [Armillaria novae-zelandiae]